MNQARVLQSTTLAHGEKTSFQRDTVELGSGEVVVRDFVVHPGAVAVVALDDEDQVLLIRQYRHPVREWLWEIPAGLMDVAGERPEETAARELAEEGGVVAESLVHLLTTYTSPGMSTERAEIFCATGLTCSPGRSRGRGEEATLQLAWVDLGRAATMIAEGTITNSLAIMGILATTQRRAGREVAR